MKKIFILLVLLAVGCQALAMDRYKFFECRAFFKRNVIPSNKSLTECHDSDGSGACGIWNRYLDILALRCAAGLGPVAIDFTPSTCQEAVVIATGKSVGNPSQSECEQSLAALGQALKGASLTEVEAQQVKEAVRGMRENQR